MQLGTESKQSSPRVEEALETWQGYNFNCIIPLHMVYCPKAVYGGGGGGVYTALFACVNNNYCTGK